MGWKKAGWYSYDQIDTDRIPSAERIIPELQDLQIADLVPEEAEGGWTVAAFELNRLLQMAAHAPMSEVEAGWIPLDHYVSDLLEEDQPTTVAMLNPVLAP